MNPHATAAPRPLLPRRRFLQTLGASLAAGCDVAGRVKRGSLDSGTRAGRPTADTGAAGSTADSGVDEEGGTGEGLDSGSGDTSPSAPALADTGPALDPRLPRSLLHGDAQELDIDLVTLSGTLPDDIEGHMFLVHAVPQGGAVPVLLGDGRMVRFDFHPDRVAVRTRMARTPCHYADRATAGTAAGFENMGLARTSMVLGNRNMANTGWLVMGDRLLLTYDGGRPWEVDPDSLSLATAVGHNAEWPMGLPEWLDTFINWPFPLHLSTAHPAHDPDSGEVFSVAYGLPIGGVGGFVDLVRWDGAGALERFRLTNDWGWPVAIVQSVHQIAITRNWVVIMDTAFLQEMEQLWDESATRAQAPDTVVWLVRRSDLRSGGGTVVARSVTIPREAAHFLVDYDDTGDRIQLHCSHNCAADPSEFLGPGDTLASTGAPVDPALHGMLSAPTDLGALGRHVVDALGARLVDSEVLYDEDHTWGGPQLYTHAGAEAPGAHGSIWWIGLGFSPELRISRMEALYAGYPHRELPLSALPGEPVPARLFRVHAPTLEILDSYALPPGRVCLSPQHLPRRGATDELDGYIAVTVISDDTATPDSSGDELWIFDAANLAQGPLVRLGHTELHLPFTLHTVWMPAIASRRATYRVDVEADHAAAVSLLSPELQEIFAREVYPHFS